MKKYCTLLILLLSITAVHAQQATISGKVTDLNSAEALEGATIRIMRDSTPIGGAYADDQGAYQISTQPGTYDLVVTYISYDAKTIKGIQLQPGQAMTLDIQLGTEIAQADDRNIVVIQERVVKNTEAALLTLQRRSTSMVDVISLEQVKRAGDNDAASAMKRVTGVTVESGKYIYVRGLGDRYTKTLLNGAEIPGLDPNRNAVQMDMFPASLIDNLVVHKTFSPELPGSYTGGLVKITTKDFPQQLTLQASTSAGFNTAASLRDDFLTGTKGALDFLGMDDGTRALPAPISQSGFIIPDISFSNPDDAQAIDLASKAFAAPIYPTASRSGLNQNHSLSFGDQKTLFGKPFGYIASLSYTNTFNYLQDYQQGRWVLTDHVDSTTSLNPQVLLSGSQASQEALWGGLVNFSYLPHIDHRISVNYLHNQSGNASASYLSGGIPKDDPSIVFETRAIGYTQRALDAIQTRGDHTFGKLKGDWILSYTHSSQDEPDLRFFSNDFTREDSVYDIQRNLYTAPSRYFRKMDEDNIDAKVNLSMPFTQWQGLPGKLAFGAAYTRKYREFFERRYEFINNSPATIHYNGNDAEYWSDQNLGVIGQDHNGLYQYGITVTDASELRNNYIGSQGITAAYAMAELPLIQRLRLIAGARAEHTAILLTSKDPSLQPGALNNLDILPSINLIYNLLGEGAQNVMNLRATYARTIARPVFRELAPYASFDFVGDMVLVGNPDLERTLIDNIDLRWEWFPNSAEIISASAFYKDFHNPIEMVINPMAANLEGNYRNVERAKVYGVEFEFRKRLGFISPYLQPLRASGNLTLIHSSQDIAEDELGQIRALNPEAPATRAMFGQSPYALNAELAYVGDSTGLTISASFNLFGPRISAVSRGGTPNVMEMPRPTLDAGLSKEFGQHWAVAIKARNLIDPEFRRVHNFHGKEYVFSSYRIGRSFSLGLSWNF